MKLHPIATLFPAMEPAAFESLKASIEALGQLEPVWYVRGEDGEELLIDGRHRARACEELGREMRTRLYSGADPVAFVLAMNLERRHLTESQLGIVGGRVANLPHGGAIYARAHSESPAGDSHSAAAVAQRLHVGRRTIDRGRHVLRHGVPELVQAVEAGTVALYAADAVAKLPAEEQRAVLARGEVIYEARADRAHMRRPKGIVRPMAETVETLAAGIDEGKTPTQMAATLGVSRKYAMKIAAQNGLVWRIPKNGEARIDHPRAIAAVAHDLENIAVMLRSGLDLDFSKLDDETANELWHSVREARPQITRFCRALQTRSVGHVGRKPQNKSNQGKGTKSIH